jgi:hypothetical protein
MRRRIALAAATTAAVALAACGSARVVYQQGNTGVIELSGDTQKAMDQANDELATICGAHNASIAAQGYENTDTPVDRPPPPGATTLATLGPDGPPPHKIWRIRFLCGAAATPPLAPIANPK